MKTGSYINSSAFAKSITKLSELVAVHSHQIELRSDHSRAKGVVEKLQKCYLMLTFWIEVLFPVYRQYIGGRKSLLAPVNFSASTQPQSRSGCSAFSKSLFPSGGLIHHTDNNFDSQAMEPCSVTAKGFCTEFDTKSLVR